MRASSFIKSMRGANTPADDPLSRASGGSKSSANLLPATEITEEVSQEEELLMGKIPSMQRSVSFSAKGPAGGPSTSLDTPEAPDGYKMKGTVRPETRKPKS
jgi:hypothetical protein